jgi:hypothetical protein
MKCVGKTMTRVFEVKVDDCEMAVLIHLLEHAKEPRGHALLTGEFEVSLCKGMHAALTGARELADEHHPMQSSI